MTKKTVLNSAHRKMGANDRGVVSTRTVREGVAPSATRTVSFGGRDWQLGYYAKTNSARRAEQTAVIVAAIGFAITAVVCGLFGYVAYNNLRLSREIQVRIGECLIQAGLITDDGEVTHESTETFLRNFMTEFAGFIARVYTALPRNG